MNRYDLIHDGCGSYLMERDQYGDWVRWDDIPEGCTPTDARVLREANHQLAQENFELKEKLSAIKIEKFNVREFIRRCQDHFGFDVKTASKMLEIAKYIPADKPAVAVPEAIVPALDPNLSIQWHKEHYYSQGWNDCRNRVLEFAPSHSQQSADNPLVLVPEYAPTEEMHRRGLKEYNRYMEDGCHSTESLLMEYYAGCMKAAPDYDRCPSNESEQSNWLVEEAQKVREQTKDWPQWRKDAIMNSDAYSTIDKPITGVYDSTRNERNN